MRTAPPLRVIPAIAFLLLAAPGGGPAQETAPGVPLEPVRVQDVETAAPIQMRVEDAARLRRVAPAPRPPEARAAVPGRGVSRRIAVPQREPVNASRRFLFRDVTDRSGPAPPAISPEARRAAVESYRRSRLEKRSRGGARP